MDVEQAINRLRVVRELRPDSLPDEDVRAILEAGRRTDSSKNLQRWQFITVRDRSRLEELSKVGRYAGHLAGASVGIALVTPELESPPAARSVMWDVGRAAQNMTLAAWARGIGSAPATVYEQDVCRGILGYPEDQRCEYILSFGYPADPSDLTRPLRAGGRRPLEEVVRDEQW